MQKVIVKYFDSIKYEEDWYQYYEDEKTIHSNRLISPTDLGFSSYLKNVEVETEKYIVTEIENDNLRVMVKSIEIDDDYLYVDIIGVIYSHIHTFRKGNELYKKYKVENPLVVMDKYILQIDRDLKLKTLSL